MKEKNKLLFVIFVVLVLCAVGVMAGHGYDKNFRGYDKKGITGEISFSDVDGRDMVMIVKRGLIVGVEEIVAPEPDFPVDGLVSYYKLDEVSGDNVLDSYGDNDGINDGATQNVDGKIGGAYSFLQKTSNKINFGTSNFNFQANESFTMSGWFYSNFVESDSDMHLFQRIQSSYPWNGYGLAYRYRSDGTKRFQLDIIGSNGGSYVWNNYNMPLGEWLYIVFTYDGSENPMGLRTYVNGEEIPQTTVSGTFSGYIPSDIDMDIGGRTGIESSSWGGKIDEVGIWDRVLTDDEIANLYNNGNGLTYNP
jgi:hypothetical protein